MTTNVDLDSKPAAPRWWRISVAVLTVVVALLVLVVLAWTVDYVHFVIGMLAGVYGLGLAGLVWLILLTIGAVRYSVWRPMLASALLVVALAGLAWFSVPSSIQRAVSTAALNNAAAACPVSDGPVWVGAYRFTKVTELDGHCFFYKQGFIDGYGVVRLPDGPPADPRKQWNMSLTKQSDDWYRFTWHF